MCVLQTKLKHPEYQPMAKESLQLAVHFLFHTYLHTKKKLRYVRSALTSTPVHEERPSQAAVFYPDSVLHVLTGWTPRSGWPPWRCCSPRAAKRASGWCSTWLDRRGERSPGQTLCQLNRQSSVQLFCVLGLADSRSQLLWNVDTASG